MYTVRGVGYSGRPFVVIVGDRSIGKHESNYESGSAGANVLCGPSTLYSQEWEVLIPF